MTIRDWMEAEQFAADQMRHMRFEDVQVTGPGTDRGIDVRARDAVAQVKHHVQPVGGPTVQQLIGTGGLDDQLLLFSLGGYTVAAVATADEYAVALFAYTADRTIIPANDRASVLLRTGWFASTSETRIPEHDALRTALSQYVLAVLARGVAVLVDELPKMQAIIDEFEATFDHLTDEESDLVLQDPTKRDLAERFLRARRQHAFLTEEFMPMVNDMRSGSLNISGSVAGTFRRFRMLEVFLSNVARDFNVDFASPAIRERGLAITGLEIA